MRGRLVAISVLIALVMVSSSVQAQEETEEEDNVIIDVVLPLALAFIMFSLGLGLTTGDFALVFSEPRAFYNRDSEPNAGASNCWFRYSKLGRSGR